MHSPNQRTTSIDPMSMSGEYEHLDFPPGMYPRLFFLFLNSHGHYIPMQFSLGNLPVSFGPGSRHHRASFGHHGCAIGELVHELQAEEDLIVCSFGLE